MSVRAARRQSYGRSQFTERASGVSKPQPKFAARNVGYEVVRRQGHRFLTIRQPLFIVAGPEKLKSELDPGRRVARRNRYLATELSYR